MGDHAQQFGLKFAAFLQPFVLPMDHIVLFHEQQYEEGRGKNAPSQNKYENTPVSIAGIQQFVFLLERDEFKLILLYTY